MHNLRTLEFFQKIVDGEQLSISWVDYLTWYSKDKKNPLCHDVNAVYVAVTTGRTDVLIVGNHLCSCPVLKVQHCPMPELLILHRIYSMPCRICTSHNSKSQFHKARAKRQKVAAYKRCSNLECPLFGLQRSLQSKPRLC